MRKLLDQVGALVTSFDFAVNESCAYYQECGLSQPFTKATKPVFEIEYADLAFCAQSRGLGLSGVRKNLNSDAWRVAC